MEIIHLYDIHNTPRLSIFPFLLLLLARANQF